MYPVARLTCSRNVIAQFQRPAVSAMWANQVKILSFNWEFFLSLKCNSLNRPAEPWPLPLSRKTLTPLPSSSVPELPPLESPDPELVSALSLVPSSLDTPATLPSSNSSFPMPFWDLLCLRLWDSSVWWWPFCSCSLSKHQKYTKAHEPNYILPRFVTTRQFYLISV